MIRWLVSSLASVSRGVFSPYPIDGEHVGHIVMARKAAILCALCTPFLLMACATPDAPGISGRWRPVNRFVETPQAIPLQQAYVFQASPVDGTLKTMLDRWAKDSRMALAYLHPNDYTLHAPVARIRTSSLEEAAAALSSAYRAHGVKVTIDRPRIVVSQVLPDEGTATASVAQGE